MYYYVNHTNNIRIWKTFCIILTVLNTLHNPIVALKCYICGDPDNVLLNINTTSHHHNPVSCDELNRFRNDTATTTTTKQDQTTRLLEKFIMKCPEDYQGCITQIQDGKITRSCDIMPIDDCQTANGITYCYCSYDLCNIDDETKSVSISSRSQTSFKSLTAEKASYNSPYFDDEDYFEMSGDKNLDTTVKELELESPHQIDENLNDLKQIAKEHNERVSTLLKILSTISPTTSINLKSSTMNVTTAITAATTTSSTTRATIMETTTTKQLSTTRTSTTEFDYTIISTTTATNPTIYSKDNSWIFKTNNNNNNYNENHQENYSPTTRRTSDFFPTTKVYNNINSDSNQNNSDLIKFFIYLILIPLLLGLAN